MLKLPITYVNYNDETVTENFYFNLSEPEIIEMDLQQKSGLKTLIEKLIDTKDNNELVKIFKEIILRSYGEKSEDGKRFIKSDQIRTEFTQTAAYPKLFMDLATNDGLAATFIKGIMPKSMSAEIDKVMTDLSKPPVSDVNVSNS